MKFFLSILLSTSAMAADKPWTALFVYSDGRLIINENIKTEKVCREAICAVKHNMSCNAKEEADKITKEKAEKAKIEYEQKVAEWRAIHPCKPDINKETKKEYLYCSMPNGGQTVYDKDGKEQFKIFGTTLSVGHYSSNADILKYSVCFQ